MIKLASHNTMTYLTVKQWWLKPFGFIAKCLSETILELYVVYDIRHFDFRVSFDKKKKPIFKHGIFKYKGDVYNILNWVDYIVPNAIIRINLEEERLLCSIEKINLFYDFCKEIELKYPNITFYGGAYKRGGKIYDFKNYIKCKELYASVTKKYGIFDDIFPWIYAFFNNQKDRNKDYKGYEYLMLDFILI